MKNDRQNLKLVSSNETPSPDDGPCVHVRTIQEMALRHADRIAEIAAQIRAINSMKVSGNDRTLLVRALERSMRYFEMDAAAEAHFARMLGMPDTAPH